MDFAEVIVTNKALVKVAKLYRGAQATLLAELGLHPGQDVTLWHLGQEPAGLLVNEIADRLGVEPPTVTRTLARLESGGWFTREPVPGDRRAVRIQLTEKGRATLPQVEAMWQKLADTATAGLDPAERQQLVTLLDRVRTNLTTLAVERG
ncbi:MarR family winged helix-turn-helix transcriptional regulator [Micromonospora sp. NPDC003197]